MIGAPRPSREAAAVYRLFDEGDALLYIGMTVDPAARFANHRRDKPWWKQVHHQEITWHPTALAAAQAEAQAIREEHPRWNVAPGVKPDAALPAGRPATGKTPVRSVRLPDPLWDAVRQVAEAKGWTASDVVAAALHRYITAELASEGGAAGQPTPPVGSP